MTDIIPNDLSHLSDAEFFALCPQGHHAPGPEPLSPAARTVLDAAFGRWMEIDDIEDDIPGEIAAAALRAAALYCKRDSVILLSLADELEQ